jgi:hypothetical protein
MARDNKTFIKRSNKQIIFFDATVRRSETNTATLSKYPVEEGFKISDHISVANLTLSVEGSISLANNSVLNLAGVGTLSDPDKARTDLKEIFENKEEILLVTPEFPYSGVYITSLVFSRESPTRGVLTFSMRLERPRKVSSQTSVVPAEDVSSEVKKALELKNSEGTVNVENVEEDSRGSSAALDVVNNLAELVFKGGG